MSRLILGSLAVGLMMTVSGSLWSQTCDSGAFSVTNENIVVDLKAAVAGLESCQKNTKNSAVVQKWVKLALPECSMALKVKEGKIKAKDVQGVNYVACPTSLKSLKEALKKDTSSTGTATATAQAPSGPACGVGDVADKLICIAGEKVKGMGPGGATTALRQKMLWAKDNCKPVTKKDVCDKALVNLKEALQALQKK